MTGVLLNLFVEECRGRVWCDKGSAQAQDSRVVERWGWEGRKGESDSLSIVEEGKTGTGQKARR